MEIDELKRKKLQLEVKLAHEISFIIEKFKDETKISPSAINVYLMPLEQIGKEREYVVDNVSVDLDI